MTRDWIKTVLKHGPPLTRKKAFYFLIDREETSVSIEPVNIHYAVPHPDGWRYETTVGRMSPHELYPSVQAAQLRLQQSGNTVRRP